MGFPKNFDFGVASSAYQVEGAWNANGKGTSIWDTYAAVPGNIADGTTGKVGCDHYHHYLEDIALMKEMGVDSYRFFRLLVANLSAGDWGAESGGTGFL